MISQFDALERGGPGLKWNIHDRLLRLVCYFAALTDLVSDARILRQQQISQLLCSKGDVAKHVVSITTLKVTAYQDAPNKTVGIFLRQDGRYTISDWWVTWQPGEAPEKR